MLECNVQAEPVSCKTCERSEILQIKTRYMSIWTLSREHTPFDTWPRKTVFLNTPLQKNSPKTIPRKRGTSLDKHVMCPRITTTVLAKWLTSLFLALTLDLAWGGPVKIARSFLQLKISVIFLKRDNFSKLARFVGGGFLKSSLGVSLFVLMIRNSSA